MINKCEIKINNDINHEGKYLIEIVKIYQKKKFIKQYYLSYQQLLTLQYYINEKNIPHKIINQDNLLDNQNILKYKNEDKLSFSHHEFKNNQINSLESYKKTLRAKYNQ